MSYFFSPLFVSVPTVILYCGLFHCRHRLFPLSTVRLPWSLSIPRAFALFVQDLSGGSGQVRRATRRAGWRSDDVKAHGVAELDRDKETGRHGGCVFAAWNDCGFLFLPCRSVD